MRGHILGRAHVFPLAAALLLVLATCSPVAAPDVDATPEATEASLPVEAGGMATATFQPGSDYPDEVGDEAATTSATSVPTVSVTREPTVDPPERAVSEEMECSSEEPGIEATHDDAQISLEKLIDSATVIVRASGVTREQIRIRESAPDDTKDLPLCQWVVYAEMEVSEYLKGRGPDTLRVALPVAEVPRPERPTATVEDHHDIEIGAEYVLFLREGGIGGPRDQSDMTWTVLFESHGRWPMEGERLLTRLEPPEEEMTLGELRTAIFPLGPRVLPTVGPLGRAVGAATDCSSDLSRLDKTAPVVEVERLMERLALEELIDSATVIVHARGGEREQVSMPELAFQGETVCGWVVFAEIEVMEYLKGEGPDSLSVVLPVEGPPLPRRPLARVEGGEDIEEGLEYVLFLQHERFGQERGLSGRHWTIVGGRQGRWELEGGAEQYGGMEPAVNQIPIDELRRAISAQLSP